MIIPPIAPIIVARPNEGVRGSAVIDTRPANAPLRTIVKSALPYMICVSTRAAIAPPAAAVLVFAKILDTDGIHYRGNITIGTQGTLRIEELDELLETGFTGQEVKFVKKLIRELDDLLKTNKSGNYIVLDSKTEMKEVIAEVAFRRGE